MAIEALDVSRRPRVRDALLQPIGGEAALPAPGPDPPGGARRAMDAIEAPGRTETGSGA